jgi:hypothetical protein
MGRKRHWIYSYRRSYSHYRWRRFILRWCQWEMPWTWLLRVRCHRRERIRYGFSRYDWINFDTYVCGVIADACWNFREHSHGHPGGMTQQEWHATLTRIEVPLRRWVEEEGCDMDEQAEEECVAALRLFVDHFGCFWD